MKILPLLPKSKLLKPLPRDKNLSPSHAPFNSSIINLNPKRPNLNVPVVNLSEGDTEIENAADNVVPRDPTT